MIYLCGITISPSYWFKMNIAHQSFLYKQVTELSTQILCF